MSYLNTHARTTTPTNNDKFQPAGRTSTLFGVFVGYVKDVTDVQKNGRLKVWIAEFGSSPDNKDGWIIVNYCSPFAGATNVDTISKANTQTFEGTQTSYGMWMIPPDINNQVLVMFVNGDPSRGIWIGSLYNQFMNNMVPGQAYDVRNWQYPGKEIPVAEYNKWDDKVVEPNRAFHPYEKTKFGGLGNQGLITDKQRGVTTSSARRESPSAVFGILTPGPVIDEKASPADIRRKGGSAFIMDDLSGTEYVQLTTKSGAQIKLDETNGFVYLINRDGTAWVQMDQAGNVDIFGATNISMRAQRDFNIRADRNVNIEAGQNVFIKAAQDTVEKTTTFTYDVNNIPKPLTIPVWSYVGEGKGQGGNIVLQTLNNLQSTSQKGAFITTVENNLNIKVNNEFNLTTVTGSQNYKSNKGIRMTTDASFDLLAKDNIRIGSNAVISVVGEKGIIVCTNANMSLNATGDIVEVAGGSFFVDASDVGIDTDVKIGGKLDVTSNITGGTIVGNFPGLRSGPGAKTGGPGAAPSQKNPEQSQSALSANPARPAEIKPLNDKINILATWKDPESKFVRNAEGLQTTVSRFPTYEPCPEHENFKLSSINGYAPVMTQAAKTYEGSGGTGNSAAASPPNNTDPGANNTSVTGDPAADSAVTKDFNMEAYKCQLSIHEGIKFSSYVDSVGLPTAGIGHLLRAPSETTQFPVVSPVGAGQVDTWYQQDAPISIAAAQRLIGTTIWGELSDVRKRACADLCYNLGERGLAKFVMFLAAMRVGNFEAAGKSLRESKWFTQVGRRGPNIVAMIVQNVDPNGCDKKFPPK